MEKQETSQSMEEKNDVAKAMQDLENLYCGIPDDSVDLTFSYLSIEQNEVDEQKTGSDHDQVKEVEKEIQKKSTRRKNHTGTSLQKKIAERKKGTDRDHPRHEAKEESGLDPRPEAKEEIQKKSLAKNSQGTPHSNRCALCGVYIHFFRHRCLVCGKAHCKKCVGKGMGEMTEGRKCIECLGRRFSKRYIKRAGKPGCCCKHSGKVKRQELIWAEKGPTRSTGEGK